MRFLHEWQKIVHQRNREKGFYDYEQDLAMVKGLLDETYRGAEFQGFGSEAPVALSIDLSRYWALARIVKDYEQAMLERKLLLVIGELCEAHEELRSGRGVRESYTVSPNGSKHVVTNPNELSPGEKPEGFPIELADAQIRLWDLEEVAGIDGEAHASVKHDYNSMRPYKHGRAF